MPLLLELAVQVLAFEIVRGAPCRGPVLIVPVVRYGAPIGGHRGIVVVGHGVNDSRTDGHEDHDARENRTVTGSSPVAGATGKPSKYRGLLSFQ